ncbi:MAG: hypothetical protein KAW86_05215 [Bacteroidales bacterium]|nr:hypothetical protein [Bacteroidales bacterium]
MYLYGWINSFNWLLFSNLGSEMAGICMFKSLDVNFLSNSVSCVEKISYQKQIYIKLIIRQKNNLPTNTS